MTISRVVTVLIGLALSITSAPLHAQNASSAVDSLRGYWTDERAPFCMNEYSVNGNELSFKYAQQFALAGSSLVVTKWGEPNSVTIKSAKGNRVTTIDSDGRTQEFRLDKSGKRLTITAQQATHKLIRCNYFGEPMTQKAKDDLATLAAQRQQYEEEHRAMAAERAEARRESCLSNSESCSDQCRSELLSCRTEVPSYRRLEERNEARVMCTTAHGRCLQACREVRRTC